MQVEERVRADLSLGHLQHLIHPCGLLAQLVDQAALGGERCERERFGPTVSAEVRVPFDDRRDRSAPVAPPQGQHDVVQTDVAHGGEIAVGPGRFPVPKDQIGSGRGLLRLADLQPHQAGLHGAAVVATLSRELQASGRSPPEPSLPSGVAEVAGEPGHGRVGVGRSRVRGGSRGDLGG